eukprot:comp12674_c0_seq1/m.7764 comp12674_c0_seq1/g.7764  ORF comp12674_c0_seq1/g.7764 comp12674_c0_seq1/m.7764 type:complete len:507 (-) comp12674_c0_seq1:550-2070(-)
MATLNTVQEHQHVNVYTQAAGSPPTWVVVAKDCTVTCNRMNDRDAVQITVTCGDQSQVYEVESDPKATPRHTMTQPDFIVVTYGPGQTIGLLFADPKQADTLSEYLTALLQQTVQSEFDKKTDKASSQQYFHYYGQLAQQQNMLQDLVRTGTYQKAMLDNAHDFKNKVVLDVGAGTGMLSFFALQAGAKKVYAVEASNMAENARTLAHSNGLGERLIVVKGKIEEIELPEKVDMIISEPMGILLVNERMLETYMIARKWLKPDGNMFPTTGVIYMSPFQDDYLYMETYTKSTFWSQPCFYGVDLRSLNNSAIDEYFSTPIVDAFDPRIVLSQPVRHTIDFLHTPLADMETITMPFSYTLHRPATVHGLAFWFDVLFAGSEANVWLSTSPYTPLTHWYQVRCLLREPVQVAAGETIVGKVVMVANTRQSYYIHMELGVEGSSKVSKGVCNLKDPFYRASDYSAQSMYGSANASAPAAPAANSTSDSDQGDAMSYTWANGNGQQKDSE